MKRVYFIKPIGMAGPIKIGNSFSPDGRLETLSTWSPFALELLATIAGGEQLEMRFHVAFEHLHLRREWFAPGLELVNTIEAIRAETFDIDSLPPPHRITGRYKPRPRREWTPDERYIASARARLRHTGAEWQDVYPRLHAITGGRGAAFNLAHKEAIEGLIAELGGNPLKPNRDRAA